MKQNLLSVLEWSKKNHVSLRTVRTLIKKGVIKTQPMAIYIQGIDASFKFEDAKKKAARKKTSS